MSDAAMLLKDAFGWHEPALSRPFIVRVYGKQALFFENLDQVCAEVHRANLQGNPVRVYKLNEVDITDRVFSTCIHRSVYAKPSTRKRRL